MIQGVFPNQAVLNDSLGGTMLLCARRVLQCRFGGWGLRLVKRVQGSRDSRSW